MLRSITDSTSGALGAGTRAATGTVAAVASRARRAARRHRTRVLVLALLSCAALSAAGVNPPSPYAGQEAREIKALAPSEIAELMDGKGMGLARAAELNGYPGPAHVLELANDLELTADQRQATEALFRRMQDDARVIGREVIEAEQALDTLFAGHGATANAIDREVGRIGALQAKLRAVHLRAHLAQVDILTRDQTARYAALRGYAGSHPAPRQAPHPHAH